MKLSFRVGSIPVRIHASILLTGVLLGIGSAGEDPARLVLWVAIVVASILNHEFGHALMGMSFGLKPEIDLYAMGGLTSWSQGRRLVWWRSVLVSVAGPGVGLFVAGVLIALFGVTSFFGYSGAGLYPPTNAFAYEARESAI